MGWLLRGDARDGAKYADKDVINPSSVLLSGVMMFDFIGMERGGAVVIEAGIERHIAQKRVTYDLERMMEGAKKLSTSAFATAIIENMQAQVVGEVRAFYELTSRSCFVLRRKSFNTEGTEATEN